MAHESFGDEEIAALLNRHFISIKVDKEERPDIDSIYMAVCQAFTGSGGWPTSIFMTAEQKPFFAGTYFPKTARYGSPGCIFSLLALYDATFNCQYLRRAEQLMEKVEAEYFDPLNGGFFFYGREQETLIARPKESYDGAIPSGNSLMAYNLVRLGYLSPDEKRDKLLQSQLHFMGGEARQYPAGFALFLTALSDFFEPALMITVVRGTDDLPELPFRIPLNAIVKVLDEPVDDYRLLNGESTFYVCKNHSCLAPMKQADFYNSLKSL